MDSPNVQPVRCFGVTLPTRPYNLSHMKPLVYISSILLSSLIQAGDLSEHPMLKHYIGKWTAEGTLKGKDGNEVVVSETYEGKVDGENAFLIEGSRTIGSETQSFKWNLSYNAPTDTFEVALVGQDGNSIRFEGHASEATRSLELKAITGPGQASISVVDTFTKEGNWDEFESKVVLTGEDGTANLEGTLIHKREK